MTYGTLYLDSADTDDAAAAADSGVVSGITTNPAIMAASTDDPVTHLRDLLEVFPSGPVFHQLTSGDADAALTEVETVDRVCGDTAARVVFKLPAQPWLFALGARLAADGRRVAYTAVYSPGQVVCAREAGARWVIPYVDRAARLDPAAGPVVPRLTPHLGPDLSVLAASIKSPGQALQALRDGAAGVTTTWEVISALMVHPLTDSAVEEFNAAH
ncbi:transaldolase family protein [Actinomadura sp. HBU206391]|uniref:transaldolase family protein n=1 Tax=Actinomadura sp. HBU206391 TaxID=2731692 RepID=UPI00164F099F|nr:transaldolase family protein [Actinomadura sp. HBU206391]MBC6460264.1 transaldolase [Actinomadura sp. HBU206391]